MRHTVSERRKRWFFVRSLFKSFWEHLDKRASRRRTVAVSRPLFAEALEARVMFSASPVPVEQEQEPVDEAPVAQEAEMPVGDGAPQVNRGTGTQPGPVDHSTVLTPALLQDVAAAARQLWIDSGISAEQLSVLDSATYQIEDLGNGRLGKTLGTVISIDDDAANTGAWFIDATPLSNEEFDSQGQASATGGAANRYDLLSTLLHEQGNLIGVIDVPGGGFNVMNEFITRSLRRLPHTDQADSAIPGGSAAANYLSVPGGGNLQF